MYIQNLDVHSNNQAKVVDTVDEVKGEVKEIGEHLKSEKYILGAFIETIGEEHEKAVENDMLINDDVELQDDIKEAEGYISQIVRLIDAFKGGYAEYKVTNLRRSLNSLYDVSLKIANTLKKMLPLLKKHKALLTLEEKDVEKFGRAFRSWLPRNS